ncbi:MAG TPA: hypothetical protein VFM58_05535 [Solirubrobacteraceae bacterium]|nr:hypothetical protein [Solirubrobacteraceae bacterium]
MIARWTDGPPPALPDEGPDDGRTIRWSAGALDGVLSRHGESTREPARGAELAALIEQAATGDAGAREALYEAARADGIVFALDEALDGLALTDVDAGAVAALGRSLMRESLHREPLKLAVALVGRLGDDSDVPALESLARHDEFSLVAGVALTHLLGDSVQAWWRVGCLATGWGKIEAVGRLAREPELPAEVRAWLLRHGCDNAVMPEYLAHACATAGRLEEALAGLVDDELLDGACTIVRALVNGGPAEDIGDYEAGPRVAAAVVELVAERAPNLVRLDAVVDIRRWAEDFEQHVAIAERCGRALARAEVRAFVAERLADPGAVLSVWAIAEATGLDPWEPGWEHLQQADQDAGLYYELARTTNAERWGRLVAFAEQRLPLVALASGPRDRLFPAPHQREGTRALAVLVQGTRSGRWSAPLVAAALLSPVISTRNAALHALNRTPPGEWGGPVRGALRRLVDDEPVHEVRVRAKEQLARLAAAS